MQGIRVLLVEDDFILNLNLREHLQDSGFSVESVYCGAAAYEAIDRGRPLLALVSDIDLGPGADGLSVARRARDAYPGLPVVFMSAASGSRHAAEGVAGSVFVAKPFDPREVVAALTDQIRLQAA
ncbi:MAG: response regulator [Alphaproteobacteria bacterium]|nr:response regulator [Alphaproteobacteria bacterium]MBU1514161.1 response regulator [Alphaproteobacteria bacterium]MBU2096190.1 response regulator [Alphaproteobacteria bacterium]MBU2151144.1 response regulator [Alphaproteobacteria bacterium]MBU2307197.1 response regulator [Alphaproteobacteria bacterium]